MIKEKEFRLDGVFVPLSDDPTVPMVFAEAQMQSDPRFYGRYFSQLLMNGEKNIVFMVVLYIR